MSPAHGVARTQMSPAHRCRPAWSYDFSSNTTQIIAADVTKGKNVGRWKSIQAYPNLKRTSMLAVYTVNSLIMVNLAFLSSFFGAAGNSSGFGMQLCSGVRRARYWGVCVQLVLTQLFVSDDIFKAAHLLNSYLVLKQWWWLLSGSLPLIQL